MLCPETLSGYRANGYCVVPNFFDSREVDAMRRELEDLKVRGLIKNVATEEDGKTHTGKKLNLQICPIVGKSPFFEALPFRPGVAEAIGQLIGNPVVFRLDQIFLKPAHNGAGTNWHQDNFYFGLPDHTQGCGMWIAMHDANVTNGTMHLIPGWEQPVLPHDRDPDSDHHSRCWPDESKAVPVEVPAGGALFFHYGVPHCTRGNRTDKDRAGLALHFFNQNSFPGATWAEEIRAVLSGPDCTHGLKERGRNLRGEWERLVEERLSAGVA